PDPHPAPDRTGRQRPTRQAGRVGADRGRSARERDPARIHALPGRGSWLRQAREPAALLCRGRAVPGAASGRSLRAGVGPLPRLRRVLARPSHPAKQASQGPRVAGESEPALLCGGRAVPGAASGRSLRAGVGPPPPASPGTPPTFPPREAGFAGDPGWRGRVSLRSYAAAERSWRSTWAVAASRSRPPSPGFAGYSPDVPPPPSRLPGAPRGRGRVSLRSYAAAERFLAQHLGGRCEPE